MKKLRYRKVKLPLSCGYVIEGQSTTSRAVWGFFSTSFDLPLVLFPSLIKTFNMPVVNGVLHSKGCPLDKVYSLAPNIGELGNSVKMQAKLHP